MSINTLQEECHPERMAWYRDLVEEMMGMVPVVRTTTVPMLIDGKFWQVPQVVASVPASDGSLMRGCGGTEELALRELCELVFASLQEEECAGFADVDHLALLYA